MIFEGELKPVAFLNRKGLKLFGILHLPPKPRKDRAVIILSPGIKSRVAPHRLYVKMARNISAMGFSVLRFDPHGIGDSEGEIEERMAADFYGTVQVGRFVEDTIDAMNWMEKEQGIREFTLAGLCGGAITGLLAGAMDNRAQTLIGLGMPVILDSSSMDQTRYMTRGQLDDLRGAYLRKIAHPKAWGRFLSMKSDYRLICKSILTAVKGGNSGSISTAPANAGMKEMPDPERTEGKTNLNPYFAWALHKMSSTRKVVLIFSGADRLHWEFEEKYLSANAGICRNLNKNIEIHMINNANHVLTFKEWQNELLAVLSSSFPTAVR